MAERREPKTGDEMVQMRRSRNRALLAAVAGLAVLFFLLTIVRMGSAIG